MEILYGPNLLGPSTSSHQRETNWCIQSLELINEQCAHPHQPCMIELYLKIVRA
ncbi:hypothetical protein CHS0354_034684, partial [Potamilus streckersoni]